MKLLAFERLFRGFKRKGPMAVCRGTLPARANDKNGFLSTPSEVTKSIKDAKISVRSFRPLPLIPHAKVWIREYG